MISPFVCRAFVAKKSFATRVLRCAKALTDTVKVFACKLRREVQRKPKMHERTIGYQLREDDAVIEPEVYRDDEDSQADETSAASAFVAFLERLHNASQTPRTFTVLAYAALWHMNHHALRGATQRELADYLGVSAVTFNVAVKRWAMMMGMPAERMRLRDGAVEKIRTEKPRPVRSRLDSMVTARNRLARSRGSWMARQLSLPLRFTFSFNAN